MTRGAWMCSRQYDDGLKIWFAPRENEKPFTDSERAQKWRLSLASLLFFTVLLSDHLWFCAEAKLTRTRDKERQRRERPEQELLTSMGEPPPAAQAAHRLLSSSSPTLPPSASSSSNSSSRGSKNSNNNHHTNNNKAIFLGNSTKPLWRLETCYPQRSSSGQCFIVEDADTVCQMRWSPEQQQQQQQQWTGNYKAPGWNLTDLYLSFCNSYTLWELFAGLSNPDSLNCSLDVVLDRAGEKSSACNQCVLAYQRYDQHAQEKYEEFELMLQKYLQSDEYSVNSCPEDCKVGALLCYISLSCLCKLVYVLRHQQRDADLHQLKKHHLHFKLLGFASFGNFCKLLKVMFYTR
uniref:NALCN channel auxiliary factor 1 n=1 Tax=Sphenodon punctatus TaxID=8508 RepID=A0A8D0L5V8_SPHPU